MSALTNLTIAGARDLLAKGEISARELTEAHIAAVEAARSLNAFITETPEKALEMAEASDPRRTAGQAGLPAGSPNGMRELCCTAGVLNTTGARTTARLDPATDSPLA